MIAQGIALFQSAVGSAERIQSSGRRRVESRFAPYRACPGFSGCAFAFVSPPPYELLGCFKFPVWHSVWEKFRKPAKVRPAMEGDKNRFGDGV